MDKFRNFFEEIYSLYNKREFVHTDPIDFPHKIEGNKEFIAFTASCFAYGNVKAIKSFVKKFFDHYGTDPHSLNSENGGLYYRFQSKDDITYYTEFIKRIYGEYGSIEAVFNQRETLEESIVHFYQTMKQMCSDADKGFFFLMPNPPETSGGAKRLRMFLRWMIRADDVDLGLWDSFSTSELKMPIDTHILRFAKNNGVITNDSASKKNLETVSDFFRSINKSDPAKYDFALTRLGIVNDCKYQECEFCIKCPHKNTCIFFDKK